MEHLRARDVCFMHRLYWNEEKSEKQMVQRGCVHQIGEKPCECGGMTFDIL